MSIISINANYKEETVRTKQSESPKNIMQNQYSQQIILPFGINSTQYEINKEIQDVLNSQVLNLLKSPCITNRKKKTIGKNFIKMQKQIIIKNNAVTKIMRIAHERFIGKYRGYSFFNLYGYYQIKNIFDKKITHFTTEINELKYNINITEYLFKYINRREIHQILLYLFTAVYNYDYKTYNKKINEVLIKNQEKILITYSLISNYYSPNNNSICKINLISNLAINEIPNIIPNYFLLIPNLYKILRKSIMKQKYFKLGIKNIKMFNEINNYKNEFDNINDIENENIYQNISDENLDDYSSFADGEEMTNTCKIAKKKIDITANQENNFNLYLEENIISETKNIKNEQKNINLYEINKYKKEKNHNEDDEISNNYENFKDNEIKEIENLINNIEENENNDKTFLLQPYTSSSNKSKIYLMKKNNSYVNNISKKVKSSNNLDILTNNKTNIELYMKNVDELKSNKKNNVSQTPMTQLNNMNIINLKEFSNKNIHQINYNKNELINSFPKLKNLYRHSKHNDSNNLSETKAMINNNVLEQSVKYKINNFHINNRINKKYQKFSKNKNQNVINSLILTPSTSMSKIKITKPKSNKFVQLRPNISLRRKSNSEICKNFQKSPQEFKKIYKFIKDAKEKHKKINNNSINTLKNITSYLWKKDNIINENLNKKNILKNYKLSKRNSASGNEENVWINGEDKNTQIKANNFSERVRRNMKEYTKKTQLKIKRNTKIFDLIKNSNIYSQ